MVNTLLWQICDTGGSRFESQPVRRQKTYHMTPQSGLSCISFSLAEMLYFYRLCIIWKHLMQTKQTHSAIHISQLFFYEFGYSEDFTLSIHLPTGLWEKYRASNETFYHALVAKLLGKAPAARFSRSSSGMWHCLSRLLAKLIIDIFNLSASNSLSLCDRDGRFYIIFLNHEKWRFSTKRPWP